MLDHAGGGPSRERFDLRALSPSRFVFGGSEVAERAVEAVVVKPADVFDGGELELLAGAPHAVGDQLGLEAVDERFGQRVVDRCRLRLMPSVRSGLSG